MKSRAAGAGKGQPLEAAAAPVTGQHRQQVPSVAPFTSTRTSMPSARMRRAIALVRGAVQVLEAVAGALEPLAHVAAVVGAGGDQRHLDAAAVVRFQHLHHQLRGGVLLEIGRQVGDAQRPAMRTCRSGGSGLTNPAKKRA